MANKRPAFPETDYYDEKPIGLTPGMTLRDYFAAQALTGLLACYAKTQTQQFPYSSDISERAYEVADAMLEARDE